MRTCRSSRRCYHAGVHNNCHANVHLIDGEDLNDRNVEEVLGHMDGILVPGGFGQRAFEGKICAARYARTHDVPFLGICLGMQAAVCEYARDVADMPGATSAEFDENAEYPVIDLMPEQEDVEEKGGTMRLGAYPCKVAPGSVAYRGLRRGNHLRAPSSSLRGEQRLPRPPCGRGPYHFRRFA